MKKLHLLIIRSYLGPFILTFFITLFIFVMQFLWKWIDELVGKGLEWYLVAELLFYASANLVPMALPLSILLASIMTFGSFGEHYELVAMKSSGMHLLRIMLPLLGLTILTSMMAFMFTNYLWPKANLEFASLHYDIRHKKPSFEISEGVFYNGIEGYVMRVGEKSKDGHGLKDVLIYTHRNDEGNKHTIRADSGRMEMSADERYLIFNLFDGTSYEEMEGNTRPHMETHFEKETIRFDLSGFALERSDKEIFKDNYQMLNLNQLDYAIDSLHKKLIEREEDLNTTMLRRTIIVDVDSVIKGRNITDSAAIAAYHEFKSAHRKEFIETAITTLGTNKSTLASKNEVLESSRKNINRHLIEWHRKFTLSIACVILFFIGAPLGAIIRKGGLGLPVVISVGFFLVYHITSVFSEKLSKEGDVEPYIGMWIASALLFPVGLYLTYQASTDSRIFDMETYSRFVEKVRNLFVGRREKESAQEPTQS